MFNTKLKIAAGVASTAVLLSSGVAFAMEGNSNKANWKEDIQKNRIQMQETRENIKETKEEWKEKREENQEQRCEVAEGRIDNKINKFDENKENHVERYRHIKEAVSNLVTRLKEKGLDTGNLEKYLTELDSKIKDMASDYQTFIDKLKATKSFACGNSNGDFLAALNEAKSARLTVWQDAVEIRKYIIETIRPEMKRLRDQLQSKSTDNN
jgi:chromosome segregation ATPase